MNLSSLDVLALAGLPESALIPQLANKKLDQPFLMEDARILVRALLPDHGTLEKLARAIYEEVGRQRPIRDARRAHRQWTKAREWAATHPLDQNPKDRHKEWRIKLAKAHFGDYIQDSFDEEILSLLELMTGAQSYRVSFLDVGSRPVTCCLVKIQSDAKDRPAFNFLLYKVKSGKVKGAPTAADNVKDAWAEQVPEEAFELSELGYEFKTDFENQTMIATHPDGDEIPLVWRGRLDDPE